MKARNKFFMRLREEKKWNKNRTVTMKVSHER